ncbi:hypothetical protein Dda_1498 [Drechslerella dactyloides]|uniref:Uncharacterized protein n=1 Tax=Drechslerella dactyloides TaxID=74499 RepID=A0AAD6J252_DREDA|nr:hypothetical protein Dda_1498 [Drechslerella dactyloides]
MVQNPRSLVLRTEIISRPEEQEHNPRSRPQSPAPFLPPVPSLPSIQVTTPTGERFPAAAPPAFEATPALVQNRISASWKEREAEFDRQFSFPPRDMPSQPPPAYTSTAMAGSMSTTSRQRRLNLPKINPHSRVSSINPSRSPIDCRRWHEKRRNIASIIGVSLCLLLAALLLNYCYILPKLRREQGGADSDAIEGYWNMGSTRLEVQADGSPDDKCAAKDTEFVRCANSRFLTDGDDYSFELSENDDGTFTGIFSKGIFSANEETEVKLTPSRYGLMSRRLYSTDVVQGKLSDDGCWYQTASYVLVTVENGKPTFKITEQQMVSVDGNSDCILPQGRADDSCQCMFIGTKSSRQSRRR